MHEFLQKIQHLIFPESRFISFNKKYYQHLILLESGFTSFNKNTFSLEIAEIIFGVKKDTKLARNIWLGFIVGWDRRIATKRLESEESVILWHF